MQIVTQQELKKLAKEPDFKVIKFPVKIRDIHKIEKKSSIWIQRIKMQKR